MRQGLLLLGVSLITAFIGICVAEWLTFDTYAAEVESCGITHATLVEKATLPELVVVSLP